jgi:hypothetical protein
MTIQWRTARTASQTLTGAMNAIANADSLRVGQVVLCPLSEARILVEFDARHDGN